MLPAHRAPGITLINGLFRHSSSSAAFLDVFVLFVCGAGEQAVPKSLMRIPLRPCSAGRAMAWSSHPRPRPRPAQDLQWPLPHCTHPRRSSSASARRLPPGGRGPARPRAAFRQPLGLHRAALHPSRAPAARPAASAFPRHPQRASDGGAAGRRPAAGLLPFARRAPALTGRSQPDCKRMKLRGRAEKASKEFSPASQLRDLYPASAAFGHAQFRRRLGTPGAMLESWSGGEPACAAASRLGKSWTSWRD